MVTDSEYWRQKAPWLFYNNDLQKDLYMENAAAGYYDNLPEQNVPMQPAATKSGWDFLDQQPDMTAYNNQIMAENQATTVQKEPSKWDQFSKGLLSVFPDILNAYVFSRDKTGSAIEAYNKEKQRQFDNQMTEKMYKQKMDEIMYKRDRQKILDAKDDYRYETGRNDKKDSDRRAAEQWDREFGLKSDQANDQRSQWEKTFGLQETKVADEKEFNDRKLTLEGQKIEADKTVGLANASARAASAATDSVTMPTEKDLTSRHLREFDAMVYRYKRPSDYIADLERYQQALVQRFGRKTYDNMVKSAKSLKARTSNAVNKNYRAGSRSPMRYYIETTQAKNLW